MQKKKKQKIVNSPFVMRAVVKDQCKSGPLYAKLLCGQKRAGKAPSFRPTFTCFIAHSIMKCCMNIINCYYSLFWIFNHFKLNDWEMLFSWTHYITEIHGLLLGIVFLLHFRLSEIQWAAFVLLAAGCTTAQLNSK